jgi:hypothetical protein
MMKQAPGCLVLATMFLFSAPDDIAQASITRVEQDDPTISYSGNWYSNEHAAHSAGTAALTNAAASFDIDDGP